MPRPGGVGRRLAFVGLGMALVPIASPARGADGQTLRLSAPAQELVEALRDGGADARRETFLVLDQMGTDAILPLAAALEVEDEVVRSRAIERLVRMVRVQGVNPGFVTAPLVQLLHASGSAPTRTAVARTLAGLGPAGQVATPLLIQIVDGRDPAEEQRTLRRCAVEALVQVDAHGDSVPALERALEDRNPAAAPALWQLDPLVAQRTLDQAAMSGNVWACTALVRSHSRGAPRLVARALDLDGCRLEAVHWLGEGDDPAARRPLERALSDTDASIRKQAVEGLRQLMTLEDPARAREARRSLPALAAALGDPDDAVRAAAATALASIGPVPSLAVAPLARLLTDPDARVRRKAAEAIGAAGLAGRPAGSALVGASADPDRDVREAAAGALRDVKWGVSAEQLRQEPGIVGAALLALVEEGPLRPRCLCVGVRKHGGLVENAHGHVMRTLRARGIKASTGAECDRKRTASAMPICLAGLWAGPITWRAEDVAEVEVGMGAPFEGGVSGVMTLTRARGTWEVTARRLDQRLE